MPQNSSPKDQVFNDFINKVKHLGQLSSVDELLENAEYINDVQQLFTTIKVLQSYKEIEGDSELIVENNVSNIEDKIEEDKSYKEEPTKKLVTEELISDNDKVDDQPKDKTSENVLNSFEFIDKNDLLKTPQENDNESSSQEDNLSEIAKNEVEEESKSLTEEEREQQEHKLRLASIKGLTPPVIEEETIEVNKVLASSNNESNLQDFRLDLNDKVAFSKVLFDGRQSELNDTINRLNSFKTIEDAQNYLSEVYYERNWESVDNYAQRLWSLVENKFL